MVICGRCKIEMKCIKTGAVFRWEERYCKRGDLYECPVCENQAGYVMDRTEGYESVAEIPREFYVEMAE